MTDEQLNEAQRLIAGGMSQRAAAERVGVKESTLRGRLKRETAPQPAPELQSDPELASLLPPGTYDALAQLDIARMAREGQERYRLDYYNKINRLND